MTDTNIPESTPVDSVVSDDLAIELFNNLIDEESFSIPTIDWTDPNLSWTKDNTSPLYGDVSTITMEDLTDRTVGGTGIFDGLMVAMKAHLQLEYEKGRITGNDYATVYLQSTQSVLAQAVQFLLNKDQAYYASILAQSQARRAEIEAVTAAVTLNAQKVQLALAAIQANTAKAEYALTKLKLSTEDAQYNLLNTQLEQEQYKLLNLYPLELELQTQTVAKITYENDYLSPAQLAQVTAQTTLINAQKVKLDSDTAVVDYQLSDILPTEKTLTLSKIDLTDAQVSQVEAEISQINYTVSSLMPAQLLQTQAQTSLLGSQKEKVDNEVNIGEYNLSTMLPQQLLKEIADKALVEAQTNKVEAEHDGVVYSTSYLLPAQKLNVEADTAVKSYQATTLLPAQVANTEADTLNKDYQRLSLFPAQLLLVKEQAEAKRAETLDTRSDSLSVSGSIGKQKALLSQQITSYQRDSENKTTQLFLNAWTVAKQTDEGIDNPFTISNLETILGVIQTNNGLV